MTAVVFAGLVAQSWIFYERFVESNLYGGEGRSWTSSPAGVADPDRAMGLERVVSLPFP